MQKRKISDIVQDSVKTLTRKRTRKSMVDSWEEILNNLLLSGYQDKTIKKAITEIRSGIKSKLDLENPTHKQKYEWLIESVHQINKGENQKIIGIVTAGQELAARVAKADRKALSRKANNTKKVNDLKPMIKTATLLLSSWDWKELAVAICLLTGRRSIEVLKTAKFTPKGKQFAVFKGQAKSKSNDSFLIPTLADSKKIASALKRLRSLKDLSKIDNEKIHQNLSSTLLAASKKHFRTYTDSDLNTHDLRKIYTRICTDMVMSNQTKIRDENGNILRNERLFVQAILGHEKTSAGLNYETWEIASA